MALNINRRTVTTVRHEWWIESPATQVDIVKAITFAGNHMKQNGMDNSYDDSILVRADDEVITVYYEQKVDDEVS